MPTQVQIRGNVEATQEARTLVTRELDVNTTAKRINLHDGTTVGGIPHINYVDQINQEYTYAAASGTNTITMSLAIAPSAYAAGQKFCFKAASTNTGSATLNVNSLGAKTIKKKDNSTGTIAVLAAGDIIGGGIYTVFYDGTDMILESVDSGGLASVSQGDLNTTTQSFSQATANTEYFKSAVGDIYLNTGEAGAHITLSEGEYGFSILSDSSSPGVNAGWWFANDSTSLVSGAMPFTIAENNQTSQTVYGSQRYITSSPPFTIDGTENGDIAHGYIFIKFNKSGEIVQTSSSKIPPWAYNGKTNIRACAKCPLTNKKFRRVKKPITLEEIMDGAPIEYQYEEITQKLKIKDMESIPHPFGKLKNGDTVVMIDPLDERVKNLLDYQDAGEDFIKHMLSGKIYTRDDNLKRFSPKGVKVTPLFFK